MAGISLRDSSESHSGRDAMWNAGWMVATILLLPITSSLILLRRAEELRGYLVQKISGKKGMVKALGLKKVKDDQKFIYDLPDGL